MMFGDYCYNPDFILDAVNETTSDPDFYNLLNYYLHCVGDNPVGDFLTDITDELDDVITDIDNDKSTWENIGGTCTQEMNGLVTTLDSMNTNVANLLSQFDCTPINNAW